MKAPAQLWAFYDDVVTGHHPGYASGVIHAAARRGWGVIAAVPRLVGVDDPAKGITHLTVEPRSMRQVLAGRRQLRSLSRRLNRLGVEVLCDLYFDKNVWVMTRAITAIPIRLHVVHHAEQFTFEGRSGMARIRTMYLRKRLRRAIELDGVVVAHTARAADIIGESIPTERIARAGYPVGLPQLRPLRQNPGPFRLLFVGGARNEKGLHVLLEALTAIDRGQVILEVIGRQPTGVRAAMEQNFAVRVEWNDSFVEEDELHDAYRRADVVVLPYTKSFAHHGGPSSVLLEALAFGVPVLTTTALEQQLPASYRGAVVVESDSAEAMADGIMHTLNTLEALEQASRTDGRTFIAAHHTYDAYAASFEHAATMSKARIR